MALRKLKSMEYDDFEKYDFSRKMSAGMPEPPDYPYGLNFSLKREDLEKAGGDPKAKPGATMPFSAIGEVTSCHESEDSCRIEVEFMEFAGSDGEFFALERPTSICLQKPELDKLDLDADCDIGDMIHLVGEACLRSKDRIKVYDPDGEEDESKSYDSYSFQIERLSFEEESEESREGEG